MTIKCPIIEEIREVRDRIAALFNYDVRAIGRYYQERQHKNDRSMNSDTHKTIDNHE